MKSNSTIEVVDAALDAKDERRAAKFVKAAVTKADEILRLRATADQLAGELASEVSNRAPELSDSLTYEDCVVLLRAMATVIR